LKEQIVIITGASSGIGAEIAKLVDKKGDIPILIGRSLEKLNYISSQLKGRHDIYQVDITCNDQVKKTVKQIISKYEHIDVLINNAGFGVFEDVIQLSVNKHEEMINVNYLGMVRFIKSILPYMIDQKQGHIINVASVAGKLATAKAAGYAASKFAVIGFSNGLRQELSGSNIHVSVINPGPVKTPFFEIADPSGNYQKNINRFMLTPEKVAEQTVRLIKSKKKEQTIPSIAGFGVKLYHLFPYCFDKLLGKRINRK